jgi:hypothetical protein
MLIWVHYALFLHAKLSAIARFLGYKNSLIGEIMSDFHQYDFHVKNIVCF